MTETAKVMRDGDKSDGRKASPLDRMCPRCAHAHLTLKARNHVGSGGAAQRMGAYRTNTAVTKRSAWWATSRPCRASPLMAPPRPPRRRHSSRRLLVWASCRVPHYCLFFHIIQLLPCKSGRPNWEANHPDVGGGAGEGNNKRARRPAGKGYVILRTQLW